LEISAQSIAEAFTTTFEQVLISGINAAIDAAEAAMARMPQIEDFVGNMDFGGNGGGDGGGLVGGATGARVGGLSSGQLSLLSAEKRGIGANFGGVGFSGLSALQSATPSRISTPYGGLSSEQRTQNALRNVYATPQQVNIYSSAITPRTLQNSLTTAAGRSGVVTTNRPGSVSRRVD